MSSKKLILDKKQWGSLLLGAGVGSVATSVLTKKTKTEDLTKKELLKNLELEKKANKKLVDQINSCNRAFIELKKTNEKLVEQINNCNRAYTMLKKLHPDLLKLTTLKQQNIELMKKLKSCA